MFHAGTGMIKNRNDKDLTEAEEIKKRLQEHTDKLYNKDLHNPDNHDFVVTHLKPDILKCEVKWALGSITINTNKAIGGDRFLAEPLKILKDDAVKVLHLICQKRLSNGHSPGKGQFSFQHKKEKCQRMFKVPYNWAHFICW